MSVQSSKEVSTATSSVFESRNAQQLECVLVHIMINWKVHQINLTEVWIGEVLLFFLLSYHFVLAEARILASYESRTYMARTPFPRSNELGTIFLGKVDFILFAEARACFSRFGREMPLIALHSAEWSS